MKNKSYTILPVEFLAIVSNDESGIFQVMSFDTKRELDEFAEKTAQDKRQKLANLEAYIQFLQNLLNKSGDIIIDNSGLFEKEENKNDE